MLPDIKELIFVGIDVSDKSLIVDLGEFTDTITFNNDQGGLSDLLDYLEPVRQRVVVVLMKAQDGIVWKNAWQLLAHGFAFMAINPHEVHSFLKSRDQPIKEGDRNAKALSNYAKSLQDDNKKLFVILPDSLQQSLLKLVKQRINLVDIRDNIINNLKSNESSPKKQIEQILNNIIREIDILDIEAQNNLRDSLA